MLSTNQLQTVLIVSTTYKLKQTETDNLTEAEQKRYILDDVDKFLDEHVFGNEEIPTTDGVWCYAVNILRSFLLLADIKDAVAPNILGIVYVSFSMQFPTVEECDFDSQFLFDKYVAISHCYDLKKVSLKS